MAKFTSVDDYLASLTPEQRAVMEEIEARVLTVAPDADIAPYAGAKGTLKLPYADLDLDLVERVLRRLAERP